MKIKKEESVREFYNKEQDFYLKKYWENNENDLFRPNGFPALPDTTYQSFSEEINKDGKVLDLGCGNGLMLKYLMETSGHKLIPYGADFMEKSIEQAKNILFPEYADNFENCNVADYSFGKGPFDFIFTFLSHIYPPQRKKYIEKVIKSCKRGGKVIFYGYSDTIKPDEPSWIGEAPELKNLNLEKKGNKSVSIAILIKR
jgi:2-polyprenyl-3-methyl-5-hydroxy-6-metoxy-1,4-benzoquinol methylase